MINLMLLVCGLLIQKLSSDLPVVSFVQDVVARASFIVVGLLYLYEFFELMLDFLHEISGGIHQHDRAAACEIFFVLMSDQLLNTYPPSVQNVDDPVQD